jgi:hypothetical protein
MIFQDVLRSGSDPTGYDENLLIFGQKYRFKTLTVVVFFYLESSHTYKQCCGSGRIRNFSRIWIRDPFPGF